jgi:eukaryotic-like serine/threonine-protein kinase
MGLILQDAGKLDSVVVRELQMLLSTRTIDRHIDGYELIRKLGESDMSIVFQAMHLATRTPVAIKVIIPGAIGDLTYMDRYRSEVKAAMMVVHPNVVCCHGVGQSDNKSYIVFEFMAGGDLRSVIRRKMGPLDEREALPIAGDCALGLMAIHAHGLVHRDIKPSNILIDASGKAKIADLGLAGRFTPRSVPLIHGVVVGSPGYMSPEHAGGLDEPDIRSDIYSLGATLYYLLSGHCPFTGRSPMEVILNTLHHDPLPLHEIAPEVSPGVVAIVTKCMSRLPRDRYRDSTEVRQEIDRFMTICKAQSSASTNQLWIPPENLIRRWATRVSRYLRLYARKISQQIFMWRHRRWGICKIHSGKDISILSGTVRK